MSYILDALRRAEAERERGAVPGLHSVNLPQADGTAARGASTGAQPARWLVAAAVLLALVGGAWWLAGPRAASDAASADVAAVRAPVDVMPAPAAPTAVAVAPPALPLPPAAGVAPPGAVLQLPTPPVPAAVPSVPAVSATPAATAVAPTPTTAAPAAFPTVLATPAAIPAAGPAPAAVRTIALAELSPELRREWPPLVLGGSIYSDSPGSRFVIANGQVVREGQSAAPGVVVERITQRSVLLRWRELRVEVPL